MTIAPQGVVAASAVRTDRFESLHFSGAPAVVVRPPGPNSQRLLRRQAQRESNARTYARGLPFAPAEALGATIKDVDGNIFIDALGGAGTLNVGHNNPSVMAEVRRFLASDAVLHGMDFPTNPKDRFIESLFGLLPTELREHGRIQFCGPAGTDATDAAIKLAKTATGRHEVIAFQGGYHGMGQGPLSLMGATAPKRRLGALLAGVHFMPYAYCARCPLGLKLDRCDLACAHFLGSALSDSHSGITTPAAIIVEAVQGEGGSIVPPTGWLRKIAAYARAHDVPLVCDEIQSGMGRTGTWFAFEHEGIVPDVVLVSKAIGGVGFPLSAVIYHERLDGWEPGAHAGTFRGNQVAMVAGAAAIEFMREHDLPGHAARIGAQLLADLRTTLGGHELVREVRGCGLMIGVEMVSAAAARSVREACFERGLIVELGGRQGSVLRLLPPLVLTAELAQRIVEIITQSLAALHSIDACAPAIL